jgi:hypothetical protein
MLHDERGIKAEYQEAVLESLALIEANKDPVGHLKLAGIHALHAQEALEINPDKARYHYEQAVKRSEQAIQHYPFMGVSGLIKSVLENDDLAFLEQNGILRPSVRQDFLKTTREVLGARAVAGNVAALQLLGELAVKFPIPEASSNRPKGLEL